MFFKSAIICLLALSSWAQPVHCQTAQEKPEKGTSESDVKATEKKAAQDTRLPFKFESPDGKFTIHFPAKPNELKQTYKTSVGTIDAKIIIYNARNESFGLVVSDFPDGHMRANGLDNVLQVAKQGTTKDISGNVSGEKRFAIGKYKGQEYIISTDDEGKQLHVRQIIVGDRLYQIMVGNSVDNADDSLVKPFMDSFRL